MPEAEAPQGPELSGASRAVSSALSLPRSRFGALPAFGLQRSVRDEGWFYFFSVCVTPTLAIRSLMVLSSRSKNALASAAGTKLSAAAYWSLR